jgi:hypothetical protein
MDDRPVVPSVATLEHAAMHADAFLVGQFLLLVSLMAATIEYCEVLQRRTIARRMAALTEEAARSGLGGLVRVFITD